MPTEPTKLVSRKHDTDQSYKLSTVAIVLISLLLSFAVYDRMAADQAQKAQIRFNELSQHVAFVLERQIRRTEDTLRSIVAFFAASNLISRQEFGIFVSKAMVDRIGIQALEWIPRVPDQARVLYEQSAKTDGLAGFTIRQLGENGMETASIRDEYFPVYYVEPLAGNEKAVGFDLASNPARKAALEQARDTGLIVSSSRITLVQESAKQAGVVVFAPMYGVGEAVDSVPQRQTALTGFALGVFRVGDLLESSVPDLVRANNLVVALYDVSYGANRLPLHLVGNEDGDVGTPIEEALQELSFQSEHRFGGRDWRLVVVPEGGMRDLEQPWIPWFAAVTVLIIVALIGGVFQTTVRRRFYAEGMVIERTRDLETLAADLALSEERSKAVVANIVDGVISTDEGGVIEAVNSAVEDIFQHSAEDLIGKNVNILAAESQESAPDSHMLNYLRTDISKTIGAGRNVEGQRKDGTTFPMELAVAEFSIHGKRMYLGVVRDITERVQVKILLEENIRNLKRSNEELEQFAYVASHDLQEPLRMVASYSDLLAKRYKDQLDERANKYIGYSVEGAKRMQTLINDLLAFSRVGTTEKEFEQVELMDVLGDVVSNLRVKIVENGARVEYADLPTVYGDRSMLGQVFQNLVANAIKFRGEQSPVICISAVPDGRNVTVSIKDNGIGIDPEYFDRIFVIFQRLHERNKHEGSGLGLAISKKIIGRHGGRIWVHSEPGQGAEFFFVLHTENNIR